MIQTPDTSSNVVLWVSAMSSFVTLVGVVVTGFVQWSASRDARDAARDAAAAAMQAKVTAAESKATMDKVEVLVNNKSDVQTQTIKDLTEQVKQLYATALLKAEAAPAAAAAPSPVVIVDTHKPIDVIDKTPEKEG